MAKTRWYTGLSLEIEPRTNGKEVGEMRAVDAVMECLKAEGVDVVFGLPGGAHLPTYDAFATSSSGTRRAAGTPRRATRRRPGKSGLRSPPAVPARRT